MKNLYEILGVTNTATEEIIKKVYRKLAKKYHPDTNAGNAEAEKRFVEITKAYEILSDATKRAKYDSELKGNTGKSNQYNNFQHQKEENKSSYQRNTNPNMMNFGAEFEKFFGYNPKAEGSSQSEKNENPFDTTKMFNEYFKFSKK